MPVAVGSQPSSAFTGTLTRVASVFVLPLAVFGLAQLVAHFAAYLPRSLESLPVWGPLWALVLGGTLALVFNRGRVVFGVLCLGLAHAAYNFSLLDAIGEVTARAVFAALCLAVPLNLAALTLLRERGVFTFYGARRAGVIVLQAALLAWAVIHERSDIVQWLYLRPFSDSLFPSHIPQAASVLMAIAVVVTIARAVTDGSALDAGMAGALACFVMACQTLGLPHHFPLFIGAAALTLVIAVLHDTFRLAFRDELTGLPSRRALNERLLTLGTRYTLAMVDVDRFKQFNDLYGHELGDHVLCMVAAKLRAVRGGGRAYRYGGEEFTLLFPGRRIPDAWPHLEALRRQVAMHPMVLRAPEPVLEGSDTPAGVPLQRQGAHVTVSIGVAERDELHSTPAAVLRAADEALYRAKNNGRDRVSL